MDRRNRKTQEAVEKALLELLFEKRIDEITIKELAEKADINRKTFYNNYHSIEEAREKISNQIMSYVFDLLPEEISIDNEVEIYHFFFIFAKSLEENQEMVRKVIYNENFMHEELQAKITPYIAKRMHNYLSSEKLVAYVIHYVTSGLLAIVKQWFRTDLEMSSKQVALLAYNLACSALKMSNFQELIEGES